jgi:hypothetical protein
MSFLEQSESVSQQKQKLTSPTETHVTKEEMIINCNFYRINDVLASIDPHL